MCSEQIKDVVWCAKNHANWLRRFEDVESNTLASFLTLPVDVQFPKCSQHEDIAWLMRQLINSCCLDLCSKK